MRQSALVLATAVLLSVGFLATRAAAQTTAPSGATGAFGHAFDQHIHVDFNPLTAPGSSGPTLPSLGRTFAVHVPVREGLDIPAAVPPIDCDCRMPTVKADPRVDPKIVTPPPANGTTFFQRGVPAPWCAGSAR